jgi:hypothetical protein
MHRKKKMSPVLWPWVNKRTIGQLSCKKFIPKLKKLSRSIEIWKMKCKQDRHNILNFILKYATYWRSLI